MKKTKYKATIWECYSRTERRVWLNEKNEFVVKLNGVWFTCDSFHGCYQCTVWYEG